jgi:hypothetical protein
VVVDTAPPVTAPPTAWPEPLVEMQLRTEEPGNVVEESIVGCCGGNVTVPAPPKLDRST